MPLYMLSSHRKFSFSHRECMNLQKGSLWNKTSFFKDIFCVKRFWPIVRVANNGHEKFTVVHPRARFLYLLDSQNFVTRKLFKNKGFIYMLLCENLLKFDVWTNQKFITIVMLAPFYTLTCSLHLVLKPSYLDHYLTL